MYEEEKTWIFGVFRVARWFFFCKNRMVIAVGYNLVVFLPSRELHALLNPLCPLKLLSYLQSNLLAFSLHEFLG